MLPQGKSACAAACQLSGVMHTPPASALKHQKDAGHYTAVSITLHNNTLQRLLEHAACMLQSKHMKSQQEGTSESRTQHDPDHTESANLLSRILQMVGVVTLSCA